MTTRTRKKSPSKKTTVAKKATSTDAMIDALLNNDQFMEKLLSNDAVLQRIAEKVVGSLSSDQNAVPNVSNLTTHVYFIIDESSSMQGWEAEVNKNIEEQIITLRESMVGQTTFFNLISFADYVTEHVANTDINNVSTTPINYHPSGWTALLDAIEHAITMTERVKNANDPNTSFLIITMTDGQENRSKRTTYSLLSNRIREKQGTDRYTFAVLGPNGLESYMSGLGIPPGNFKQWERTQYGFDNVRRTLSASHKTYSLSRAAGQTCSSTYFVDPDATITSHTLNNLDDVSGDFGVWSVNQKVPIKSFVDDYLKKANSKTRGVYGSSYNIGRAYYEITKKETLQGYKGLVIQDKDTGMMYSGDQARSLLGLPSAGPSVKIEVAPSIKYRIFVLSTSVNRNLMPNTKLLYKKA